MRRLRRRLIDGGSVATRHPERGAVAIIVALCAIVLFGIAAWVIDGSALFQERRELQRGADFAALTIAADCARGDCGGDTGTPRLTAEGVVDANSTDGQSTVPETGGVTFPASNQVKVRVVTFDARSNIDGDTSTIDYNFATVFGKTGLEVAAEATATWDVVGGGGSLPLTLSLCEWESATSMGTDYGNEITIYFHDGTVGNGNGNGNDDSCPVGPAGQDSNGDGSLPGGFGWLNQDDCSAHLNVADGSVWAARKGGNAAPNDCDPPELGDTLILPIFGDYIFKNEPAWAGQCNPPNGSDVGCYLVVGFAAFEVTGYRFPGAGWTAPSPPNAPCSGPQSCITGIFNMDLCTDCPGGGGNDFGASTVWLVE